MVDWEVRDDDGVEELELNYGQVVSCVFNMVGNGYMLIVYVNVARNGSTGEMSIP